MVTPPITQLVLCSSATPCVYKLADGSTNTDTETVCDFGSCKVEVALYFASTPSSIAYSFKFFDACKGGTPIDLPGPRAVAGDANRLNPDIPFPDMMLSLPSGLKAGYLVVVVSSPSAAISKALLVPAGAQTCT